eukprot:524784-Rhodomonas_salina.2
MMCGNSEGNLAKRPLAKGVVDHLEDSVRGPGLDLEADDPFLCALRRGVHGQPILERDPHTRAARAHATR